MYRQDTLNQNKNVIKSRVAEDFFSLFLKSAKLRKSYIPNKTTQFFAIFLQQKLQALLILFLCPIKNQMNNKSELILKIDMNLESVYDHITEIINQELKAHAKEQQKDLLLSGAEACKLFQPAISKVTLSHWVKQKLILDHRIGGRVYYKYTEIMDSLTTLKKYKNKI